MRVVTGTSILFVAIKKIVPDIIMGKGVAVNKDITTIVGRKPVVGNIHYSEVDVRESCCPSGCTYIHPDLITSPGL